MAALFKIRTLLTITGVVLLALFIWFGGPLFAFGPYRPFASELVRIILIALVIVGMVVAKILKRVRANKKSDNLIAAVVKQSQTDTKQTAEAQQLRERFEEAVATLKQKRRSGHSLYDLPWYVIIGAPGSGKTTALVNSGLKFPIEQRSGKAALRGVGGTRNCDWWFTDQAVLLDTAGRYTTQDSDASADSAAWSEFLALLRKYRGRRPINAHRQRRERQRGERGHHQRHLQCDPFGRSDQAGHGLLRHQRGHRDGRYRLHRGLRPVGLRGRRRHDQERQRSRPGRHPR